MNYTKVPNEYLEWLISLPIESLDYRVIFFVYRKTIGWNKLSDKISTSLIAKNLNASKRGVIKSISRLVNAGYLVSTKHQRKVNEYSLVNPSYPVTKNLVNCVTQSGELGGKNLVNAGSPTIYNTKETIQKGYKLIKKDNTMVAVEL
jgi:phage replication O-like protein O